MGKLKLFRRRGSGGNYNEGRTRRGNEWIDDEVDVDDYMKRGEWTEWGSMERPKIGDDGTEDEDDVPLSKYMTGKVGSHMSDRRTAVDMKSKTSNVSRAVEWNGVSYNIPDMKGWKGTVVEEQRVDYKDFSDRVQIVNKTQTTSEDEFCKPKIVKRIVFEDVTNKMKTRSKTKATREVNEVPEIIDVDDIDAVSYTHLTLPTKA